MAYVLIADDDAAVGRLFRKILEQAGHEVYVANNGEDALRLYLRHPIDVVVTDIQMARGDGLELITALKGLYPEASIVAISGQSLHHLQIAQMAGARSILAKPISREKLVKVVEEAIESPPGKAPGTD